MIVTFHYNDSEDEKEMFPTDTKLDRIYGEQQTSTITIQGQGQERLMSIYL